MRVHATVQHRKPAQDTLDENATTLEAGLSTEVPAESSDSASAAPPPPEPLPLDNSSHKLRRSVQVYAEEAFMKEQLHPALQCADAQTRFLWLHGTQGLCICKHCSRRCRTWDDLKVHIFTRSCSVLFPDSLHHSYDLSATPNRLPLLWRLAGQQQTCADCVNSLSLISVTSKRGARSVTSG